jgi:hypothetical protein
MALHHAAHCDDRAAASLVLEPSRLDQGVDRLLLRRIDESAGVDDDHVGLGRLGRRHAAAISQLRQIALAVDGVLVAAERDDGDLHR